MAVFFNGRLLITPTVASQVDDSAMANPNLNVGNVVAIIGRSTQAQPNTALPFSDPNSLAAALGSGDLVDAGTRMFSPSQDTVGPQTVIAIRVNPAVQAGLTLLDASAAAVINLLSRDYGQLTNQTKVKVEAASTNGLKLTVQNGTSFVTQDNLYRAAFSIQYTGGQASAKMTISNAANSITLFAPTGTLVATVDLTVYTTIQQVVDYINTISGFSAAVLNGNGNLAALNGLDSVTTVDVRTALYTATGTLQAVIDWINGLADPCLLATRVATAGTLPAALPFTYLSGGSDGAVTNTQWSDAFTTLQTVDVQWLVALSNDPSIGAMADAHAVFMSNSAGRERRNFAATPLATSNAAAISAAAALNSDRSALVALGMYDYNAAGVLTLYQPYILAAMIAGAFSGVNPGVAMTNKSLRIRGIERVLLKPTDTDPLISGGVLCVERTSKGTFKVVMSNTTWLNDTKFDKVQIGVGAALDFTMRNMRQSLDPIKGAPGNTNTLAAAVSLTETCLRALSKAAPVGPGVLVGDATNPPYKNIVASLVGDVIQVQAQVSPVIAVNYVLVTVFAVPFSGTASAAA